MENSKACQDTDFPTKVIKENADIFADIFLASVDDSVEKSDFPSSLEDEDITPVFKKADRDSKNNYRPVSILQIYLKYLSDVFSVNCTVLRLNFRQNLVEFLWFSQRSQYAVLPVTQAWKVGVCS